MKNLKLKSGVEFQAGSSALVSPLNDHVAQVVIDQIVFKLPMLKLWFYFPDFIQVTMEDIEQAICDGDCPTITGEYGIESDGCTSDGWPSILRAAGMI